MLKECQKKDKNVHGRLLMTLKMDFLNVIRLTRMTYVLGWTIKACNEGVAFQSLSSFRKPKKVINPSRNSMKRAQLQHATRYTIGNYQEWGKRLSFVKLE